MAAKVRWGVLGAAEIALKKVIPAMQQGEFTEITAIASRDLARAQQAAGSLGIPRAYGSYAELLADPDIEAIYNPLPNQLHVVWSVKAAEAGKHVLCEKPVSMTAAECRELIAARDRTGVQIGEAFMVRSHPQWLRARELVRSGAIGRLRAIHTLFSYFNDDPANIRNIPACGGGALMDIGCYPIQLSRFIGEAEPARVLALIDRDPALGTDRLTSAVLEFPFGHSVFTCSTQMVPYQRMHLLGETGRIEIEIPVNAPPNRPCRIWVDPTGNLTGADIRTEEFPVCDQYKLQGDDFSRAIRGQGEVPTPLENALGNMAVIEALFRSAETSTWQTV